MTIGQKDADTGITQYYFMSKYIARQIEKGIRSGLIGEDVFEGDRGSEDVWFHLKQ